jgi:hypothetical protein
MKLRIEGEIKVQTKDHFTDNLIVLEFLCSPFL